MYKEQIAPINPDKFYRCGEQSWTETDAEKSHDPIQKKDAEIKEKINQTLWNDSVLSVTDNKEFEVQVRNGIVFLSGHIVSNTHHQRIEKALQSVAGIQAIKNSLVLDDELTLVVAADLGQLEQTYHCKFFTGVSRGVVVLNGEVNSLEVRHLAEQCAANNPNVRGVINYIRVPGTDLGIQDHRFLQPPIGKEVYFHDGISGTIRQVVINPDNRRVIAMTIQGRFYDRQQNLDLTKESAAQPVEQLLVIPMSVMGNLTSNSGFLTIQSTDFSEYQKFEAGLLTPPNENWVPPYPYCPGDVLLPVEHEKTVGDESFQTISGPKMKAETVSEQLLANDSLGG
jgi:osmotically-inducible protein OsmY